MGHATIEDVLLPMLAEIEAERRAESPEDPWRGFGSVELCWAIGDRIEDEASLLHHAARRRIPLVIPGIYDGAVGAQLFMHRQRSSDFRLDLLAESGSLSTPGMVVRLEGLIDDVSGRFEPPTEFVVPGEDEVAARLDVARTVCRRAERSSLSVAAEGSSVVPYLNRLSDLVWTLARWREGVSLATRSVPDGSTPDRV